MQHKKVFIALSIFSLVAFLFLFKARIPGLAATKTTNIFGNSLLPANQTISVGDQILFENEDFVPHVLEIRRASDSGLIHTENFVAKTADTKDTYSRTFGVAGNFNLILDTNIATGSVTVLQASPSPTISASPTNTPTSSPTASPTVTPTVSPSPTITATPSPSPTVQPTATASPTPTVVPTVSPTLSPSPTPTLTSSPTVSPLPTVTASPVPSVSPTSSPTPTASATVTPTATVSPTSSVTPSPTPVQTSSPSPSVSPTSSPSPTIPPVPTVLPAFAVFRPTTCTSQINANNTQILTDKLTPVYLIRGYWSVTSIASVNNGVSVSGLLYQTQKINLLFGGNAFFGGNKITATHEQATFVGNDLPDVLVKAKNSWCAR